MPRGNVRAHRPFKLDNLDFGLHLTPSARACISNIDQATRKLGIRESSMVTAWFAAVALVSKEYYLGWDRGDKSAFGRGISDVWSELEENVPIPEDPPQPAQQEALKTFACPFFLPAVTGETNRTDRACYRKVPQRLRNS